MGNMPKINYIFYSHILKHHCFYRPVHPPSKQYIYKIQWWQKESGLSAIILKKDQARVKRPNKSRKTVNLYLKYNMY